MYVYIYAGLITFHPISDNLVEVSALVFVSVCVCFCFDSFNVSRLTGKRYFIAWT